MKETPLVTVGVVSYNAENFIQESLNSVYNQTYRNIELIVSDDHSSDATLQKINEWIPSHKDRFVRTLVISSEVNTGTSGNGNRAIFQSNGEWYKSLDGDDVLASTAIADYVDFVKDRKDVNFVFGRIAVFHGSFDKNQLESHHPSFYGFLYKDDVTAKQQYNVLTKHFAASGSSGFYRLKVLKEYGGYDERFPLMEDHPLLIKLTKNGNKLYMLDKVTLYYRISPQSITNSKTSQAQIFSNSDKRQVVEYKYEYLRENSNAIWRLFLSYSIFIKKIIINAGNNKFSLLCKMYYIWYKITDPYLWHHRFLNTKSQLKKYSK